jgi:hypothetical protein
MFAWFKRDCSLALKDVFVILDSNSNVLERFFLWNLDTHQTKEKVQYSDRVRKGKKEKETRRKSYKRVDSPPRTLSTLTLDSQK